MAQPITCTSAGIYALTRGQQYELLADDEQKEQVKVRADNGRIRWFPAYQFDLSGGKVPVLASWRFDDPIIDELNGRDEINNWVDVVIDLDDGTKRWCQMATPEYLKQLLGPRPDEPMVYARNLIVVRNLARATVEQVLRYLGQQGELIEFPLPVGQPE